MTDPMPATDGAGKPPRRTAVAAPPDDWQELFAVIDRMRRTEVRRLVRRIAARYGISLRDEGDIE